MEKSLGQFPTPSDVMEIDLRQQDIISFPPELEMLGSNLHSVDEILEEMPNRKNRIRDEMPDIGKDNTAERILATAESNVELPIPNLLRCRIYGGVFREVSRQNVDKVKKLNLQNSGNWNDRHQLYEKGLVVMVKEDDHKKDKPFTPEDVCILEGNARIYSLLEDWEKQKDSGDTPQKLICTILLVPRRLFDEVASSASLLFTPSTNSQPSQPQSTNSQLHSLESCAIQKKRQVLTERVACELLAKEFERYQANELAGIFSLAEKYTAFGFWIHAMFGIPTGDGPQSDTGLTVRDMERAIVRYFERAKKDMSRSISITEMRSFVFCHFSAPPIRKKLEEMMLKNFILAANGQLAMRVAILSYNIPCEKMAAVLDRFKDQNVNSVDCSRVLGQLAAEKREETYRNRALLIAKDDGQTESGRKERSRIVKLEKDRLQKRTQREENSSSGPRGKRAKKISLELLKETPSLPKPSIRRIESLKEELKILPGMSNLVIASLDQLFDSRSSQPFVAQCKQVSRLVKKFRCHLLLIGLEGFTEDILPFTAFLMDPEFCLGTGKPSKSRVMVEVRHQHEVIPSLINGQATLEAALGLHVRYATIGKIVFLDLGVSVSGNSDPKE